MDNLDEKDFDEDFVSRKSPLLSFNVENHDKATGRHVPGCSRCLCILFLFFINPAPHYTKDPPPFDAHLRNYVSRTARWVTSFGQYQGLDVPPGAHDACAFNFFFNGL
jgi:hypothetical protein